MINTYFHSSPDEQYRLACEQGDIILLQNDPFSFSLKLSPPIQSQYQSEHGIAKKLNTVLAEIAPKLQPLNIHTAVIIGTEMHPENDPERVIDQPHLTIDINVPPYRHIGENPCRNGTCTIKQGETFVTIMLQQVSTGNHSFINAEEIKQHLEDILAPLITQQWHCELWISDKIVEKQA
jgi:hypothetical protein